MQVIVVDNGSTDGSPSCIRQRYPSVTLLQTGKNLGFTGGNNLGMRKALEMGTDYLWLLNNDTVLERDTLKNLVEVTQKSPEVWLASPIIFFHDTPDQVQFHGSYIDWKKKRIVKLESEESFPGTRRERLPVGHGSSYKTHSGGEGGVPERQVFRVPRG